VITNALNNKKRTCDYGPSGTLKDYIWSSAHNTDRGS